MNLSWPPIIKRAREIVDASVTPMDLRDCWYVLYSEGWFTSPAGVRSSNLRAESKRLHNTYKRLSALTAEARENDGFPDFLDNTRSIVKPASFDGADDAMDWLREIYRRDRTEGQPYTVLLGIEKRGYVERLRTWFAEPLGVRVVPLGGFTSKTIIDEVRDEVDSADRPAVFLYAGDLDASGEDIERDFVERVGRVRFEKVRRVALTIEQLYGPQDIFRDELLILAGKPNDPRAPGFADKYLRMVDHLPDHPVTDAIIELDGLFQVEINMVRDVPLRAMFESAIEDFWDDDAHQEALDREAEDLEALEVGR